VPRQFDAAKCLEAYPRQDHGDALSQCAAHVHPPQLAGVQSPLDVVFLSTFRRLVRRPKHPARQALYITVPLTLGLKNQIQALPPHESVVIFFMQIKQAH
jgi:hypothetical protein